MAAGSTETMRNLLFLRPWPWIVPDGLLSLMNVQRRDHRQAWTLPVHME